MSQKNRFFIRRFRRMFIIVLLPALVLFIMIFSMTSRNVNSEMQMSSRQSVNSVEENLQLVMGNVFQQNIYLTNMTRMSIALKRALSGSRINYGDAIYLRSLQSFFLSMTNAYDYIDSALIYYDGSDRYITTDSSVHILQSGEDDSWLSLYHNMQKEQNSVIAVRTISENTASENKVLTVCQKLMMQAGCIVIDLNLIKLQNMLNTFVTMPEQTIFLLDEKGNIIAQSTAGADEKFDINMYIKHMGGIKQLALHQDGWWTEDKFMSKNLIYLSRREEPAMYIISVTSRKEYISKIRDKMHIFNYVVVMDLFIVVILAYTTTKQSFRHIRTVLWMFDEAKQGKTVHRESVVARDEYDVIMNNIVQLFLNTTYLHTQLKEKQYREENAELMALQLQINPHFLFNTLQTLDFEACSFDNSGNMHRIIRFLSEILKYALENPRKVVTLQEELSYLKKYMTVQNYRFGDNFIVYYDVEEIVLQASVFRMMLQPVLENSLIHGLRRKVDKRGYINVSIRKSGEFINIVVSDTGIGMEEEQLDALRKKVNDTDSKSIGLTNLNRRLVLYYGEQSALHIESTVNVGTKVYFTIPFQLIE